MDLSQCGNYAALRYTLCVDAVGQSSDVSVSRVDPGPCAAIVLERTAYHEAGHAVMAHLCGQIVTQVEVCGDAEHSGSVSTLRFHEQPRWGDDESLPSASFEARILCLVAGLAAETISGRSTKWQESDGDLNEAVRLALRIVGSCERVIPLLEQAHDHAVELLRRHWPAVECIAHVLLSNGNLTGEDLRRLLVPLLEEEKMETPSGRVA